VAVADPTAVRAIAPGGVVLRQGARLPKLNSGDPLRTECV